MSFWQGLQDYQAGRRERMSGRQGPMSGFTDFQFGMNNDYGQRNPSLIDAFKRGKALFSPQLMPNAPQKYMRPMGVSSVNPETMGAGAPTAYGDVRSAMAQPYSPIRPSGVLQQTQPRIY